MEIKELTLHNFRNYGDESFLFDTRSNVIFGENAQGKTNLLEAAVYLAKGESPRAAADRELIRFDSAEAFLSARIQSRGREFLTEIVLRRGLPRKISINGVGRKRGRDLADILSCVYFCPDDLFLIRAGAAERRRFLNDALRALLPRYEEAYRRYRSAWEQKTRLLRLAEEKPSLLETLPAFNEQMERAGALLIHYRARYTDALSRYADEIHRDCSGGRETLSVRYETVSTVRDAHAPPEEIYLWLREHMEAHAAAEAAAHVCLSGPHKDDLSIEVNGCTARSFSSQGQARTAALALKLAEREILAEAKEEYPILILDDVLSELDPRRQDFVLNRIRGGQVFLSCCEDDRLGELLSGSVFLIRDGRKEART